MDDGACSLTKTAADSDTGHLFEDCAWLYAFCREHLFRDHTEEIAQALFPNGISSASMSVLEVGCGPGFYARRLAQRYPALQVLGIDRSSRLVARARNRASSEALPNCRFQQGDVQSLPARAEAVDGVISSRLLLVIANRRAAIAEIFRVLKPGGRLFLAEPTRHFKTQLPLSVMRLASCFKRSVRREAFPQTAKVLASRDFADLVHSQPWSSVAIHKVGDYQCAVCEKSPAVSSRRPLGLVWAAGANGTQPDLDPSLAAAFVPCTIQATGRTG
jgi:ubiquinone/menaquinone biosynthesis C-methylase UbiE